MVPALVLIAYALAFCGLVIYSLHRGWLLLTYRRLARDRKQNREWTRAWPRVTVQLPIYNERFVVERLVDAVAALNYPRHKLQIQLLDDSDDQTSELARLRVEHHVRRGVDIEHVRRSDRSGYKAGALAYGLEQAAGEFVLILDADFLPQTDLLQRLLPPFADPDVGMVQARWGHLNESANWLTRLQALLLDAHFHIEHGARAAAGLFFNFNGTAGMWRTACLRDAGGWQADTLTEDLDISYRAQMRGWRFAYLPDVVVPAELPQGIRAFKNQQARWAQGTIETACKILPRLLRGPWSWRIKLEAAAHLTSYAPEPLTLALTLLVFPAVVVRFKYGMPGLLFADLIFLVAAIAPLSGYYAETFRANGRRAWPAVLVYVPLLLALGVGLSINNTHAALSGLFRRRSNEFVRTPKRGASLGGYRARFSRVGTMLEMVLASYLSVAIAYALVNGLYPSVPFLALFLCGFIAVAVGSLSESMRRGRVGASN